MLRTRRSGLVRRLWRSRVIPEREGGDGSSWNGEGVPSEQQSDSNPEKIPKTESAPLASDLLGNHIGGDHLSGNHSGNLLGNQALSTESVGVPRILGEPESRAMCLPEQQSVPLSEGSEGRTVMCCLFRDLPKDLRTSKSGKDGPQCHYEGKGGREVCGLASAELKARALVEQELKRCAYTFLKKLKEKPLDMLLEAVESKGGVLGDCVMVSPAELRIGSQEVSPQYLLCRLFRWPDMLPLSQLKALCHCQSFRTQDGQAVCCNPFHYSRLCGPDSPPPPYSRLSPTPGQEFLDPSHPALPYAEIEATRSPNSSTTGGHSDASMSQSSLTQAQWCNVAYWEHRTRVGRLYPVYDSSLSIFYDLPQGTGLCLGLLPLPARSSSVQRARGKIGHGILLSREPDGVWAYNRSQHPVFVNSPTLDPPHCRSLTVRRVMPGYSIKVFDYEKSCQIRHPGDSAYLEGPYDPNSVRISFAKGWGPCYSRQFITSCPCWLEILLNNHR
ncbi:mothers against decapentaplegic homolog 6a [Astyanax mexicanus]|uniref:mothers against decapentaplegic homolog 6a n=1 Tax=Astyanax mexicanus TaxID=7994 RepID=UPI0020CAA7DE|nr:mothers against decapentaplegic homolog 6a [Astyanax mexicanus]